LESRSERINILSAADRPPCPPANVFVISVFSVVKKALFPGACQEYILDKEAADTRFDQCLQGFRVLKKVVIMTCTNSAFYAKILQ
jgi:hypothetical protein